MSADFFEKPRETIRRIGNKSPRLVRRFFNPGFPPSLSHLLHPSYLASLSRHGSIERGKRESLRDEKSVKMIDEFSTYELSRLTRVYSFILFFFSFFFRKLVARKGKIDHGCGERKLTGFPNFVNAKVSTLAFFPSLPLSLSLFP